jgi:hypothetical protein
MTQACAFEAKLRERLDYPVGPLTVEKLEELPPLWLCARADVQQKYLAELDAAYRSWVDEELKMLVARHDEDPLSRPGVMQNSPIL